MAVDKEGLASRSIADRFNAVSLGESSPEREQVSTSDSGTNADTHSNGSPNDIIADDPFSNEKSKLLFEAIDRLRDCGAGQDLELPQLVIVGKQSAGKSSLLKSLTDIPFSVGDELCTRFATRIISKRTAPGSASIIKVSIEPGDVNPFGEDTDEIGTFNQSYPSLTAQEFKEIVEEASGRMGLSNKRKRTKKNFSSKVLKIELQGPNRSHFGILDLPGIIGAAIHDVTEEELNGVTEMVTAYMKKTENIIICVAVADDDLANQSILTLAARHAGNRTVGVFTKCDKATDKAKKIVDIVNKSEGTSGKALHHGWYVVRNRGPRDDALSFDREAAESSLFNEEPWNLIDARRRGTAMLKKFLSRLLCERIRAGFPKMQAAVLQMLKIQEAHQKAMGPPRSAYKSQVEYLADIARQFQRLAEQALKSPEELPLIEMNIRGKAKRCTRLFAQGMRETGNMYPFVEISQHVVTSSVDTRLYDVIRTQRDEIEGLELEGMINPAVLKPLFKIQASKWQRLAKEYFNKLAEVTMKAMKLILDEVCKEMKTSRRTQDGLQKLLEDFGTDASEQADRQLDMIWEREARFQQTTNPMFRQNVLASQQARFSVALQRYMSRVPPAQFLAMLDGYAKAPAPLSWAIIDAENMYALFEELHPRGTKNMEDEIHDLLKAYYEVAREDFITSVNKDAAEPYLHNPTGPVLGFCTEYIYKLSPDMVKDLGGEDANAKRDRESVDVTIKRLKEANLIAEETLRHARDILD